MTDAMDAPASAGPDRVPEREFETSVWTMFLVVIAYWTPARIGWKGTGVSPSRPDWLCTGKYRLGLVQRGRVEPSIGPKQEARCLVQMREVRS